MIDMLLSTTNVDKIKEFKALFELLEINANLLAPNQLKLPKIEICESGKTYKENALIKARALAHFSNMPTLADDSGLEVMVLNGKPGIHSARYAASDKARRQKLLRELSKYKKIDRKACYKCAIALVWSSKNIEVVFEGEVGGLITFEEKGNKGFGYDSIFKPNGYEETYAQMSQTEKHKTSHRRKALDKGMNFFRTKLIDMNRNEFFDDEVHN